MAFFDLFKKWPEPLEEYNDEILGRMTWSQDDESWEGKCGRIRDLIAYDREATPTAESLAYAREMLAGQGVFDRALERAKGPAISESTALAAEIAGWKIERVFFSVQKRKNARLLMVDLAAGRQERDWFMEFKDSECVGIAY